MVRQAAPVAVDVVIDDQPTALPARAPRRWLLAALAAGAVVVAAVALRPSTADQLAPGPVEGPRLSGAGLAPSLAEPWRVRWQVSGAVLGVIGLDVLVSGPDGTGVSALDTTGARVWGPLATGSTCSPSGRGVVCLPAGGADAPASVISPSGRVTDVFAPPFPALDWWVVDGDVVAVGKDDGYLVAQRWSPPGKHGPQWSYRSPDPVLAPTSYPFSLDRGETWVTVGGTRAVTLRVFDGQELASPADAPRAASRTLATWVRDDSAPGVAVVTDGDDVIVSGVGWFPAPAHLLLHGVLLVGSPDLTAYEVATGDPLWTATGAGAVSDGTLVGVVEQVAGGASLVARDLTAGDEARRVDAPNACPELVALTSAGVVLGGCGTVALVGPDA